MSSNYTKKRRWLIGISIILIAVFYFISNASFAVAFSGKSTSFLIRAVSTILILLGFYLLDHNLNLKFKTRHYVYVIIIVTTSLLLSPLYFVNPNYDKLLHLFQPILLSSIVFYLTSHLKLDFRWRILFTFFIIIGTLGIFEIGEFLLDVFFDLKLQGVYQYSSETFDLIMSPITDTMIDMILGFLGSLIYFLSASLFFRKK